MKLADVRKIRITFFIDGETPSVTVSLQDKYGNEVRDTTEIDAQTIVVTFDEDSIPTGCLLS